MIIAQLRSGLIVAWLGLLSLSLSAQICTPDTQYEELGLFPEVLPQGIVGQPYEAVATAVIPETFELNGSPLDICQAEVASTTPGLDTVGLSYSCEPSDCLIEIDHSDSDTLTYGCLSITGTPTQNLDSVVANFRVFLGQYDANTDVCSFDPNSPLPLSFTVNLLVTTNLSELRARGYALQAHITGQSVQVQLTLPQAQPAALLVRDLQGRLLVQESPRLRDAGTHTRQVDAANWPAGVYLVQLYLPKQGQYLTHKLIIGG